MKKSYIISVKQETLVEVTAESDDEAIKEAYATYFDQSPETVDATIISKEWPI